MNKKNYLDLLRYYLREFPKNVVDDIILDYDEHFQIGVENGKSEEEIAEELGNPELIAREFFQNEHGKLKVNKVEKEKTEEQVDNTWKWVAIIALIVLFSPLIVGLFGGIIGLFFGLIGLIIGLIGAGIGLIVAAIFGFGGISLLPGVSTLTRVLFALFFLALSVLLIMLVVAFIQWLVKAIKNLYISIKWRMERSK